MFFSSKSIKIAALSLCGFSVGIFVTCAVIITGNRINSRHAVGGFETSVAPEFDGNLSALISDDPVISEPVVSEQTSNESSVITYQTYRVKSGDMIGFIADAFDVTQDTIISVNNIRQSRLIQPGQYLKIPSMPGIVYTVKRDGETPETIAAKYEVNSEKCALVNLLEPNSELAAGTSLFIPDAELDWATRQEINGDLFHKPIHTRYWLSSPYGWRDSPFSSGKRTFHSGIDMAVGAGTPIYAALDGKVVATGFNATYGNYVIIEHHSGYRSLYAHMSKIGCKRGNFVYTSTVIGYVGSTGMSTGPHLHFTVYKNGKTVNPSTLLN
ncbi:MAG: M23 family metallopeptidase [Treponema sp.]|nr:M23 family metallopeptidase [Treponema sp.]